MLEHQIDRLPNLVQFCKRCVVSNMRPRIVFDEEGVCSACRFAEVKRTQIDWKARQEQLKRLLDVHRKSNGEWDVIVPCSGGKDSSMVAHRLKNDYGMHPLTVTWAPFLTTEIGKKNLESLLKIGGFSNVYGTPNPELHRQLARCCFEELGDAWQPFAYGQMGFAFHVAHQMRIPLVFFGENGEAEYGGSTAHNEKPYMPVEDWAELYYKGVTIDDVMKVLWIKPYFKAKSFNFQDLTFYRPPPEKALKLANIQMYWWSYYHCWVPQENYYYVTEHTGFQANFERSEGTYSKYASLDDKLDGFHYYLAYIKFGIGRCTSDASHEIRDGHLTREEGVALVHKFDGEFPKKYFAEFLEYLQITEIEFWAIVNRWRTPQLWENYIDNMGQEPVGDWFLKEKVL